MANANLQVFDKIKESERLFMNFLQYREALNESVRQGGELTQNISQVLSRLTSLQEGFDKVPGYLQQHDENIQRQIHFFDRHEEDLDSIAQRTEQYFDKAALRLTDLMEARLQHQERDAQNAYEKWQEHFRRLNEDNIYQRILDYMRPFENLQQQQERLGTQQQLLAGQVNQTNDRLLQKIEEDAQIQQQLLKQLATLNANLEKSMEPGPIKAAMGKIFGTKR
jgi:predicted nuclease with TOPRIM domain